MDRQPAVTCACCASKGGRYSFDCLDCCARLVLSTQPDKLLAMGMLASIERYRVTWGKDTTPRREAIIKRMRDLQTSCDLFATCDQMAALMFQKKAPV